MGEAKNLKDQKEEMVQKRKEADDAQEMANALRAIADLASCKYIKALEESKKS